VVLDRLDCLFADPTELPIQSSGWTYQCLKFIRTVSDTENLENNKSFQDWASIFKTQTFRQDFWGAEWSHEVDKVMGGNSFSDTLGGLFLASDGGTFYW